MVNLVTGERGCGKTSFVLERVRSDVDSGRSVGGVASPAVFRQGHREGYDMLDLRSGQRRLLARVRDSGEAAVTVGPYVFDPAAVEGGNTAIVRAIREGLNVIVIDEIGPLEFRGLGWAPGLRAALDECAETQELIVVVRPSLIDELPGQFPSPSWDGATTISPPWPDIHGPKSGAR